MFAIDGAQFGALIIVGHDKADITARFDAQAGPFQRTLSRVGGKPGKIREFDAARAETVSHRPGIQAEGGPKGGFRFRHGGVRFHEMTFALERGQRVKDLFHAGLSREIVGDLIGGAASIDERRYEIVKLSREHKMAVLGQQKGTFIGHRLDVKIWLERGCFDHEFPWWAGVCRADTIACPDFLLTARVLRNYVLLPWPLPALPAVPALSNVPAVPQMLPKVPAVPALPALDAPAAI